MTRKTCDYKDDKFRPPPQIITSWVFITHAAWKQVQRAAAWPWSHLLSEHILFLAHPFFVYFLRRRWEPGWAGKRVGRTVRKAAVIWGLGGAQLWAPVDLSWVTWGRGQQGILPNCGMSCLLTPEPPPARELILLWKGGAPYPG